MVTRIFTLGLVLAALTSCNTAPPYDYTALIEAEPKSILVLPPLDETLEESASTHCLATITRPLAERGYYVYPVAIVDLMMRENGLPSPYEMHQVPLPKLKEVFDPDAVLYLKVTDWGSSYQVLASVTSVTMEGVLVDIDTGETIWAGEHSMHQGTGDSGGGLIGMLATALVGQVANSLSDPSSDLSRQNAWALFSDPRNGLLAGPYHPQHAESYGTATTAATAASPQ